MISEPVGSATGLSNVCPIHIMALPAGMGLSAAARAAGFECQTPPLIPVALPELSSPPTSFWPSRLGVADNNSANNQVMDHDGESSDDPEDELLGGLAALSEPPPLQQRQQQLQQHQERQKMLDTRSSGDVGGGMMEDVGCGVGVGDVAIEDDDPAGMAGSGAAAAAAAAAAMAAVSAAPQQRRELPARQPVRPAMRPRIHTVTSPPPPKPAASMAAAILALRVGEVGALPTRGVGLRAVVGGKRGRDALRASRALSEEVKTRFPRQAKQAARLSAVEDKLDKKINAVRRRLLSKIDNVEWTTKSLRCWLSLEVISRAELKHSGSGSRGGEASKAAASEKQRAGGYARETNGDDDGGSGQGEGERCGEWCVARLQGALINPPADQVERRFSSFFSKIALKLDPPAFPDVQAVEWARSAGCEELHCVELNFPLAGPLSMGLRDVTVQAVLHSRLDDDRPRRFVLSAPLRRALRLTNQVQTKPVLVAAVCEALRQRGLMRNGGDRMMLSCDEQLEALFGTTAFPFHKLEEALAPHVQPADPPVLHATVTLEAGTKTEKRLDVKVDTEAAFQLHALRALVGGGGVVGGQGQAGEQEQQGEAEQAVGNSDRALGMPTVAEIEAQAQLDRQIEYLADAANASGRRAAMLRELSEEPLTVVPRLEAQLLADEETLAADAGIVRPVLPGEMEPWHDNRICDHVTRARAERERQEQVRQARVAKRRAGELQAFRAEAAMRASRQHGRAAAGAAERERQQQHERAIFESRERKRRQQQLHQQQQQQQQQQRQATLQAQRQQQQHQQPAQVQARSAAEEASRLAHERLAAAAAAMVSCVKDQGLSTTGMQQGSETFLRMRQLQQQQQQHQRHLQLQGPGQGMAGQGLRGQSQQQQGLPSSVSHLESHHQPQHSQLSSSLPSPVAGLVNDDSRAVTPAAISAAVPPLRLNQLPPLQQAVSLPSCQGRGAQHLFSPLHQQHQQQNRQPRQPLTPTDSYRPLSHPHPLRDSQQQQQRLHQQRRSTPHGSGAELHTTDDISQDQLAQTLLYPIDDGDEGTPLPPSDSNNFPPLSSGLLLEMEQENPQTQPQPLQHQVGSAESTRAATTIAPHSRHQQQQQRQGQQPQNPHQQMPQDSGYPSRQWSTVPAPKPIVNRPPAHATGATPLHGEASDVGYGEDIAAGSLDIAASVHANALTHMREWSTTKSGGRKTAELSNRGGNGQRQDVRAEEIAFGTSGSGFATGLEQQRRPVTEGAAAGASVRTPQDLSDDRRIFAVNPAFKQHGRSPDDSGGTAVVGKNSGGFGDSRVSGARGTGDSHMTVAMDRRVKSRVGGWVGALARGTGAPAAARGSSGAGEQSLQLQHARDEQRDQRQHQHQQGHTPEYCGWQSQAERRRSDAE